MAKSAHKTIAPTAFPVALGIFTRREAAREVATGVRHVHSSELGEKDPVYVATIAALDKGSIPRYLWEPTLSVQEIVVRGSIDRHKVVEMLLKKAKIDMKRQLRERLELVLEELLTNALFHAFRTAGKEKYARTKNVKLTADEAVKVRFAATDEGCFIEVHDNGGSLSFEHFAESLRRCYESETQIQAKESGAGLGLYMIFETACHLKVVNVPAKKTTVACWIADHRSNDSTTFSFNFFDGGNSK